MKKKVIILLATISVDGSLMVRRFEMKVKWMVKAGKLANGYERGKGTVAHAIEDGSLYGEALCGATPVIQWCEATNPQAICKSCAAKAQDWLSSGKFEVIDCLTGKKVEV